MKRFRRKVIFLKEKFVLVLNEFKLQKRMIKKINEKLIVSEFLNMNGEDVGSKVVLFGKKKLN